MATLKLEIVTPEAKAYSDDVDMVVLPGFEGEMGILPNHAPLLSLLRPGELRVKKGGQEFALAVGEGFVEIHQTAVSVLTDMAIEEAKIDENATQAALDRAQAALKNKDLGGEEVAAIEAAIAKSLAQLNLKRKKRH
ncbi:MAG: ATP synthase F1 subunit epsilon [Verrucomicrobia bacterium]|nr:ATP synthase F1 subunit epsilon [Verrucomicrobiota bacterium]